MALQTGQDEIGMVGPPTFTAPASGGDWAVNDGRQALWVWNQSVSPITVTFAGSVLCDQGQPHAYVMTIPASTLMKSPQFSTRRFKDTDGFLQWTYSATASVTIAVVNQQTVTTEES